LIDCLNKLEDVVHAAGDKGDFIGNTLFDVSDVEKGLNCLKLGKASDCDDVSKKSIMYSHPVIIIHMKLLFNIMICEHGCVPDRFGTGITVPVVKDRLGDLSCVSNYNPITLSPIIYKTFEYCILHKYEHLLQSDDLKLGFKKNSSCSHALFVLTAIIEHFITCFMCILYFVLCLNFISVNCSNKLPDFRQL